MRNKDGDHDKHCLSLSSFFFFRGTSMEYVLRQDYLFFRWRTFPPIAAGADMGCLIYPEGVL